jgi:hypothetical protein
VVLDRLRAEEQRGGGLPGRAAPGQAQRDLQLLGCQVVEGRHIPSSCGLTGSGELGPGHRRPRVGAKAVEDVDRGAQLLTGPEPLPLPPEAGTVGQVRAAGFERVWCLAVQGKRRIEVAAGLVLQCEKPAAARSPGERPRLGFSARIAFEFRCRLGSLLSAAEAEVDLDKFRRRRQVDVEDATRPEHGSLLLEMSKRSFGAAETQLKVAQCGDGPHLAYAEAQLPRQAERLGGVLAALL